MSGHQLLGLSLSCHICLKFFIPKIKNFIPPLKPSRTMWGSWSWKPFHVSHFLFVQYRLQPLWPLSSKGQVQTIANQGMEGMQRQEEQLNRSVPGSWFCLKGYTWQYLLFHRTKTPNKWEMFTTFAFFIPEKVTVWEPQKLIRRPPEARLKPCRP